MFKKQTDLCFEILSSFNKTLVCAKKLAVLFKPFAPNFSEKLTLAKGALSKLKLSSVMLAPPNSDLDTFSLLVGMVTLIPVLQFNHTAAGLQAHRAEIENLIALIGEADAAICINSYRESVPNYCKPEFNESESLIAKEIYHPLIQDAVLNDVSFKRNILLTGANAAGKSTYIKSTAVGILMAQAINTCCAAVFSLQNAPFASAMAAKESVQKGESYFTAEIKALKRTVDLAKNSRFSYIFIDEILRGTNTAERIGGAFGVLQYFNSLQCAVIAATHDIELTRLLNNVYENFHFSERIEDGEILFDYKLKPHAATTSNAIKLLHHFGFAEEIVETAQKTAANYAKLDIIGM